MEDNELKGLSEYKRKYTGINYQRRVALRLVYESYTHTSQQVKGVAIQLGQELCKFNEAMLSYRLQLMKGITWLEPEDYSELGQYDQIQQTITHLLRWHHKSLIDPKTYEGRERRFELPRVRNCLRMLFDNKHASPMRDAIIDHWRHRACSDLHLFNDEALARFDSHGKNAKSIAAAADILFSYKDIFPEEDWLRLCDATLTGIINMSELNLYGESKTIEYTIMLNAYGIPMGQKALNLLLAEAQRGGILCEEKRMKSTKRKYFKIGSKHAKLMQPLLLDAIRRGHSPSNSIYKATLASLVKKMGKEADSLLRATIVVNSANV